LAMTASAEHQLESLDISHGVCGIRKLILANSFFRKEDLVCPNTWA